MRDAFTHQCEVRDVLRMRVEGGHERVSRYIDLVKQKRGVKLAAELLTDVTVQWDRGNRGERGDWREAMREAA